MARLKLTLRGVDPRRALLLGVFLGGCVYWLLGGDRALRRGAQMTSGEALEVQLSDQKPTRGLGVSLGLFASDPLWDYSELIQEIAELGSSQLLLVVPLRQEDHLSSAPRLLIPLEAIRQSIQRAHELGLKVSVMPVIQLKQRTMNMWRGRLAPRDLDRWWINYRALIKRLADLAAEESVERLVIGAELCSLERHATRWLSLIQLARRRFRGVLTYSANWDHYREVPFWDALDEVGVNAYAPLASLERLEEEWSSRLTKLERFAARQGSELKRGRPLLITEYGYPALESALRAPWDETTGSTCRLDLQADLLERSTRVLHKRVRRERRGDSGSILRGAYLWNWFGFGGAQDCGFTPRGKDAEARLRSVFKSSVQRGL